MQPSRRLRASLLAAAILATPFMAEARRLYRDGQPDQALSHPETAHVLGQRNVLPHVRTHWLMLKTVCAGFHA